MGEAVKGGTGGGTSWDGVNIHSHTKGRDFA